MDKHPARDRIRDSLATIEGLHRATHAQVQVLRVALQVLFTSLIAQNPNPSENLKRAKEQILGALVDQQPSAAPGAREREQFRLSEGRAFLEPIEKALREIGKLP
ncbi:MAG: hypothetical protein JNM30_13260 [Rhodospirillales bacterium]|nr:hypothetical protein [Rhodospirillales bacterium]